MSKERITGAQVAQAALDKIKSVVEGDNDSAREALLLALVANPNAISDLEGIVNLGEYSTSDYSE